MSVDVNCAEAKQFFALYLYGELSFDEEERVESHLDACADCRAALGRERELHAAFDRLSIEPAPSLVRACRDDLRAALLEEEAQPVGRGRAGWWEHFIDSLTLRPAAGWLRPAGALTLIAMGFFVARMIPADLMSGRGPAQMGLGEPAASRVRYVEPASDGRVQIVLDETRQRIVSGRVDDQQIRALLFSAAKDLSDPGLRAETVDILNTRAQSADVRDALVYALRHDQNAGVRMKAMEGLKQFGREPEVRSALAQALLNDTNPGLRKEAIDLLTQGIDERTDRQIIRTLQDVMLHENNTYVRQRCQTALQSAKASTETY